MRSVGGNVLVLASKITRQRPRTFPRQNNNVQLIKNKKFHFVGIVKYRGKTYVEENTVKRTDKYTFKFKKKKKNLALSKSILYYC